MISIVAIFVTALLTHQLPKSNELETRKYELNREAITIVLNDIMPFSNYYNVDWDSIAKMSYVKYSGCSLTYEDMWTKVDSLFKAHTESAGPNPAFFREWETIQKAKEHFYHLSLNAKIIGSEKIRNLIIEIEHGFDQVFEQQIIQGGYYLRGPMEAYNSIMPQKFERLEAVFRKEIQ